MQYSGYPLTRRVDCEHHAQRMEQVWGASLINLPGMSTSRDFDGSLDSA